MQKDKKEFQTRINKYIKVPQVKVIDENGKFLGVMDTKVALKMAQEQGVDLVEINPKIYPPICKIIDFGKFKYEQKKQQAEEKKKQKVIETKQLELTPATQDNDTKRLIERAKVFLSDGNKVRIVIKFRGREMGHQEIGEEKMKWMLSELAAHSSFNTPVSMDGRNMTTIISPK